MIQSFISDFFYGSPKSRENLKFASEYLLAAADGDLDSLKNLFDNSSGKFDPLAKNEYGQNAMELALVNNKINTLNYLIQKTGFVFTEIQHDLITVGFGKNERSVKKLYKYFEIVIINDYQEAVQYFIQNRLVSCSQRLSCFIGITFFGSGIYRGSYSPLYCACAHNSKRVVKYLVTLGSLEGRDLCLMSEIDENGPKPYQLYLIIEDDQIKYRTNFTPGSDYIELGGEISQQSGELYLAIHETKLAGLSQSCKEALLNETSKRGHTPSVDIHNGANYHYVLPDVGEDVGESGTIVESPIEVAEKYGHKDIVSILCKHGSMKSREIKYRRSNKRKHFFKASEGDFSYIEGLLTDCPDMLNITWDGDVSDITESNALPTLLGMTLFMASPAAFFFRGAYLVFFLTASAANGYAISSWDEYATKRKSWSMLDFAVEHGHYDVAKALIDAGIETKDSKFVKIAQENGIKSPFIDACKSLINERGSKRIAEIAAKKINTLEQKIANLKEEIDSLTEKCNEKDGLNNELLIVLSELHTQYNMVKSERDELKRRIGDYSDSKMSSDNSLTASEGECFIETLGKASNTGVFSEQAGRRNPAVPEESFPQKAYAGLS